MPPLGILPGVLFCLFPKKTEREIIFVPTNTRSAQLRSVFCRKLSSLQPRR